MPAEYHAEHVGSLLRPRWLLEARAARKRGELTAGDLREAEDRAVVDAIELQREAGLQVFTDGEMRRTNWMVGLLESIGGVVPFERPGGVDWYRKDGSPPAEETYFDVVAVTEPVSQREQHTSVEAAFLAEHAPGRFKIPMISASMGGIMWVPEISAAAYATPADLIRDLVALQVKEVETLIDQGVSWIQLDSLSYNQVFDAHFRAETIGPVPAQDILAATVAVDTEVVRVSSQ